MSFESDSEKKTPMKTTQIQRNNAGLNAAGDPPRCRQPPPNTLSADRVHGMLPARNTPPKNHHGSCRSAMGVKYRAKCSCTKKNSRKSDNRRAASQCQGTVMARNNGSPHFTYSRRHGDASREYRLNRINTAAGMAAATNPLVSTPKPVAAHANSIQRRGRAACCADRKAARL